MDDNRLSRDIPDLHSYLRWNSISKYIDFSLHTLDVGCNIGTMSIEIAKRSDSSVIAIDIDENVISAAKLRAKKFNINNCRFQVGSAIKIPFEDETFEQVLLADILEHCEEDSKVIKECYRVLKPKGKLIVNVPRPNYSNLFNKEWIKHIGHVRDGYELFDIAGLTQNYFEILNYDFNSRAEKEIDDFYNKGLTEINDELIENILKNEDSTDESYGITIELVKRDSVLESQKKPKILNVAWGHPPNLGAGPIYYLHNLCLQQQSQGNSSSCFVANNDQGTESKSPSIKKILYDSVNYFTVINRPAHYFNWENPETELNDKEIESLFKKILSEEMPDIVHFHNLVGMTMSLVKIAKNYGAATFFSLHNYWMLCSRDDLFAPNEVPCTGPKNGARCASCVGNDKKVNEFINRIHYSKDILNNYTDLILAVSSRVKEIFVANGINPKKIVVDHIGSKIAELNWHKFKSQDVSKTNDNEQIVFGFLGTLSVRKGAHILIEAVKHLEKFANKFRVDLYGYCPPGPYEQRINFLLQSNEFLKNHISLKGAYFQKNISKISQSIDIAVITSIWEDNAPQTVMEMLSTGKPIIGSDIGGLPDFVKNNENGLLYKSDSSIDLASKMKLIIENPGLIGKLKNEIKTPVTMKEHSITLQSYYDMFKNIYSQDKSVDDLNIMTDKIKVIENNSSEEIQLNNNAEQNISENNLLIEAEELIGMNKYDEASFKLNKLLEINIRNVDALNDLGVIFMLKQQYGKANECWTKVLSYDKNNDVAIENLKYLDQELNKINRPNSTVTVSDGV